MASVRASINAKWIVGRVIGTKMTKTAKVRATRMVLDNYLLKYFNRRKTYFAHDAQRQCTIGDIVLLKALPERRGKHVRHELAEIIFKVGRVIDPLTGKLCAGTTFLESLEDVDVNSLDKRLQSFHLSEGSSSQEEEKKADS
ncbi:small ribosomal subunit protein uS17m [Mantella aurantiaca]